MKSISAVRIPIIVLSFFCIPFLTYAQIAGGETCAAATAVTPTTNCTSPPLYNIKSAVSESSAGSCGGATAGTTYDRWFKFTTSATNTTVSITLSGPGSNLTLATTYIEVFNGACGSLTTRACSDASSSLVLTGLSVSTTYNFRVYVTTNPNGSGNANKYDYNMCVLYPPPPADDDCSGAISLTPAGSCSNTSGTLDFATATTGLPAGCESAGTHYDVWYKFTATQAVHTVTISSLGSSFTNPEIQLYSGAACGLLTSLQCGTTSLTGTGLTVGNPYYVRVSNVGSSILTNGTFNICVTNPIAADDCSGAVTLVSGSTCTTTSATLVGATASSGVPTGCAGAGTHYDVWFKFNAVMSIETITFTKGSGQNGKNINNPELQLFSGTCGSLTSIACGTNSISVSSLTAGTTYYVRVSNVGGSALTSNGDFNICVRHSSPAPANVDYSKSYVNISKGTSGGTVNPGDTLEIRATFVLRSGASGAADSLAFYDTLSAGEGLRFIPGSIALRTNEGKIYKSFSDPYDTDAGWRDTSINNAADTVVQINFGAGASNVKRGSLTNTSKPTVFGSTCIIMATYRVVVIAPYNSTVNLGGGELTMLNGGNYSDLNFPVRNVMVYQSPGLCPNAVSATNTIGGDFNGTFGTGTAKDRAASSNVPSYIYSTFTNNSPGDYFYGISNNTSGTFTTITTWPKPDVTPVHRVFNEWDITGDHTGAANSAKGNPPCDIGQPISASNPCGYMLVINSAYKADTAFQYSVTNLCPNTNYEISAWLKNICYKCGCDSNGVTGYGGSSSYIPSAPGDSSGVQPNLAFEINSVDYYTTGNLEYQGLGKFQGANPTSMYPSKSDSTNKWVKRGFTYLTGPAQTSLTLTIRNNAPGGGGNDWAMDDIALATCLPNMSYSPSITPMICQGNPLDIYDTVRSYFNNYTNYKWQRSTNAGGSWSDVTTANDTTTTYNGSNYQFVTRYRIPATNTTLADSADLYRLVVATTTPNLSNTACLSTDATTIITLDVEDCGVPLGINFISFSGKLDRGNANLIWTTSKENEPVYYSIERSYDGTSFSSIAMLPGRNNPNAANNTYKLTDFDIRSTVWYRVAMFSNDGHKKFSRIIILDDKTINFGLTSVINPFSTKLDFGITVAENSRIDATLMSISGNAVRKESFNVYEGANNLTINNTETLAAGMYILQIRNKDQVINKKVMKK